MHARITMLLTGNPTIGLYQEIRQHLLRERFEVIECSDIAGIPAAFTKSRPPDLVIIGPGVGSAATSLAIASRIRSQQPTLPIVLVIKDSREENAIAALRLKVKVQRAHPTPTSPVGRGFHPPHLKVT